MTNSKDIRDWVIYKITSPSGRIYIGKTKNLKRRKWAYGSISGCARQPLLHRSILKYGWGKHELEILESFTSTSSYCNDKEMFWIRTYMSNASKWPDRNGMNLTDGGSGTIGWVPSEDTRTKIAIGNKGKIKHSEEWKKANSERHKGHKYNLGRKRTLEQKQRLSEIRTGRKNKNPRRPATEETKLKMSISRIGKRFKLTKKRDNSHCGRAVIQYDICGNKVAEYSNIETASKDTGIGYHTIYYDLRADGAAKHRKIKIKEFNFKYAN